MLRVFRFTDKGTKGTKGQKAGKALNDMAYRDSGKTGIRRKKGTEGGLPEREKRIEQRLFHAVRAKGGIAVKLVSPAYAGLPDRLVLLPGGHIAFCEVKAPGERPRPLQVRRHEQLRALGFRVYVVDDVERIGEMLDEISAP